MYVSVNSALFRTPWTEFETYNLIDTGGDAGGDTFQGKIGVSLAHERR